MSEFTIVRSFAAILAGLLWLIVPVGSALADEARRTIQVFPFGPNDEESKRIYQEFKSILEINAATLPTYLSGASELDDDAESLSVLEKNKTFDLQLVKLAWKREFPIMITSGVVFRENEHSFVKSLMYVGEKTELFRVQMLNARQQVLLGQAGNNKDVHSLMIAYSLAKDAIEKNKSTDVINNYLAGAQSLAKDLIKDSPDLIKDNPDLAKLLVDIENAKKKVK